MYQTLTDNPDSANQTFGLTMINEAQRLMLGDLPWPFLEKTATATTVSGTQAYTLPGDLRRLISCYILVGNIRYTPEEVSSYDDWNRLNAAENIQNNTVTSYFIIGNQINFWPTPNSNTSTIVYDYVQLVKDISVADYTTGTVTTATTGSATITGSGTSWTAGMVGKYINITAGNAANLGDGLWYKIASVNSTTSITLSAVYKGVSIAGGSAAYTIGDCMIIPEAYQQGPVYYAAAEYWRKQNDEARADRYEQKYDLILDRMKNEEGTKSASVVIDDNTQNLMVNPNLNKSSIG